MKIKRIIFLLQDLFRRKPKKKKAEPMFHAPLNEPWATMQKQHLASQCQSYSSIQDQMCRRQCQSTAAQREWMCRNAQMQTPPQPRLPGLSVDVRTTPSPSVPIRTDITPEKNALEIVAIELGKAKGKHPSFADTPAQGVCIICEELGELAATVNDDESKERQIEEASHVAVTAIRFIEGILKNEQP